MNLIKRLVADETGNEAVEYGLILALVAGVIGVLAFHLGQNVQQAFQLGCNSMANIKGSLACPAS